MTDQPSTELQEVKVTLSKDIVQYLQGEAARRGVSAADVLQGAVVNSRFLSEALATGSKVLLEKEGKFQQVLFR